MIRAVLSSISAGNRSLARVKRLEIMIGSFPPFSLVLAPLCLRRFDQRMPDTGDAPLLSAETPWLLVLPPNVRKVSCIMKV